MSKAREIHCYDYVNYPYEKVADLLGSDSLAVFKNATQSAAKRAENVAAELHTHIGAIEVGAEIDLEIKSVQKDQDARSHPRTCIKLQWEAAKAPRLFPIMDAELWIYPLTATETQLDFRGNYTPPLGPLGSALDALGLHRIAEASVHRIVTDVAEYLRKLAAEA
ncbi:MAG: hypothetical protein ACYTG5_22860 [Planctomycetota bacterium]